MNERAPSYGELKRRLASAEGALRALRDGQVDTITGEHGTMVVRLAEAEAHANHIKQVLQTIRNVNQLILSEDDPNQLIERACCILTRSTGYYRAWIVLLSDGCGVPTAVASSGLNESFNLLDEQFQVGMYTHCMCRALDQDEIIVVEDPTAECANCSFSADHGGRSGLSRRLHHGGKTYGILSVSVPSTYAYDQEALDLFEEVAGNLSFALRKIEAAKELSDNQADLKRLARTDALTGVANRRTLMEELERECERADRTGQIFALVYIDIDNFKLVNDTHGHMTGDAVLRATAERISKVHRAIDTLGRIGGEEFAVLLPETDNAGAETAAERMRVALASLPVTVGTATIPVTGSFGIAIRQIGETGDALMVRADTALYRAKNAGRNCIVTADPEDITGWKN